MSGRRRPHRAAVVALVLALAAWAGAACGIDTDSEPRAIDSSNTPADTTGDGAQLPPSAAESGTGATVKVWFLQTNSDETQLTPVDRWLEPADNNAAGLLQLLVAGPNDGERRLDVATAIPASTALASEPVRDERGVLTVDLSEGFFDVQGNELRNAYAQIVCTVTGLRSVMAVQFESGGEAAQALDGNGQSTGRPLDCNDYDNLVPPESQPVPTTTADVTRGTTADPAATYTPVTIPTPG